MNLTEQGLGLLAASPIAHREGGHAHFWERALSRRTFLSAAGLAGGAVVSSSMWAPLIAEAAAEPAPPSPIPIPYGSLVGGKLFHFNFPVANTDVSSIFDFKGVVMIGEVKLFTSLRITTEESVRLSRRRLSGLGLGTFL